MNVQKSERSTISTVRGVLLSKTLAIISSKILNEYVLILPTLWSSTINSDPLLVTAAGDRLAKTCSHKPSLGGDLCKERHRQKWSAVLHSTPPSEHTSSKQTRRVKLDKRRVRACVCVRVLQQIRKFVHCKKRGQLFVAHSRARTFPQSRIGRFATQRCELVRCVDRLRRILPSLTAWHSPWPSTTPRYSSMVFSQHELDPRV